MKASDNNHEKIQNDRKFGVFIYSDFRYESNGIFVLGVGFFSDKFRLFNKPFLTHF